MLQIQEFPLAPGTLKTYLSTLANFDKWLKGREVNDENISHYLSYLYDRGRSPKYAKGVLSAIKWRAVSRDLPNPCGRLCKSAIHSFMRQGIGRGRGQVDGLKWEDVEKLLSLAAQEQTMYGWRDAGLISVMSDALLRPSEAVDVDVDHIDFLANTLYIPRSKTDQTGKGATQYLGPQTLEHVRIWMEKGKIKSGPLFRQIHKTYLYARKERIGSHMIALIIKKRAKAAGIEGRFSGHSLRVGAAQSLATNQATLVEMQHAGRWSSTL